MAEIQKYQNQIAYTEGSKLVNGEEYKDYSTIFTASSNLARNVTNSLVGQEAKKQGEMAGLNPGYQSINEIGYASKVFNQAALSANRLNNSATGFETLTTLYQNYKNNVDEKSVLDYENKATELVKGIVDTTPIENKLYVRNVLTHDFLKNKNSLLTDLRARQKQDALVNLTQSFDENTNKMENSAASGDLHLASVLRANLTNSLGSAYNAGILSGTGYANKVDAINKKFYTYDALGRYQNLLNDPNKSVEQKVGEARKYEESLLNNSQTNSLLNPVQKHSLQIQMKSIFNNFSQDLGVSAKNANYELQQLKKQAFDNGQVDSAKWDLLQNILPPEKIQQSQSYFDYATAAHNELNLYTNANPLQMQELRQTASANLANIDYSQNGSIEQQKVLSETIKRMDEIAKTKYLDPVSLISKDPGYLAVVNANRIDPVNNPETNKLKYMVAKQMEWGLDQNQLSVGSKKFSALQAKQINSMEPIDAVNSLNQLKGQIGDPFLFNVKLRDLKRNGLKNDYSIALAMNQNPETNQFTEDFVSSISLPNTDIKKQLSDKNLKYNDVQYQVEGALRDELSNFEAQGINKVETVSQLLGPATKYASYQILTGENSRISKAAQTAVDRIVSNQYHKIGYNSSQVLVPKFDYYGNKINPSDTQAILKIQMEKMLNSELAIPQTKDKELNQIAMQNYKNNILGLGRWQQDGDTRMVYMDVHNRPVKIKTPEGYKPMTVDFTDLGNPQSKLYDELNAEVSKLQIKGKENRDLAISRIINRSIDNPNSSIFSQELESAVNHFIPTKNINNDIEAAKSFLEKNK